MTSKGAIQNIVTKLHPTGSVLCKKTSRKRHISTEERLGDMGTRKEAPEEVVTLFGSSAYAG